VYPYTMKYLIISNFSQNVSRMNTGDLTKLWRLNLILTQLQEDFIYLTF
jgi:hypothetical protein